MDNNGVNSRDCHINAAQKLSNPKPDCARKPASWMEFKGRLFKVASTVILPKNRRVSHQTGTAGSMRAKSKLYSVKSLPQLKQEESLRPKTIQRSLSEQPHALSQSEDCSPEPHPRRILFAPSNLPITEDEDEVDSSCTSGTSETFSDEEKRHPKEKKKLSASCLLCETPKSMTSENINLMRSEEEKSIDSEQANMNMPMPLLMMNKRRDFPPRVITKPAKGSKMNEDKVHQSVNVLKENEELMEKDELEEYNEDDDDDDSLLYHDFYNCMPPPIFMLCITVAEIAFFIYHAKRLVNDPKYGFIGKFSPAPLDSRLIYNPTRRYEVWRYFTYALVHSGYMHIINNIVVQLVLGILLEMVHKWWRVLAIYFSGILAGSLATSIAEPYNYLAGASAGVYALITAHLSTVILNWSEMEYPWVRVFIFAAFVIHDCGMAFYYGHLLGEKTNVGYAAHLGGAVAGLLVGIHVLKNLQWKNWEKVLWWICIVICIVLLVFAIVWNIVRTDLFP